MNVGGIMDVDSMVRDYFKSKPKTKLDFRQAIEDYADEMLTGLTKEEREAIEEILKKYMDENPGDIEGYKSLYKALLKKFGFKGNVDVYEEAEAGSAPDGLSEEEAVHSQADVKSTAERITDEKGNEYIVIKMNNGIVFKMKVAEASADADSMKEGKTDRKNNAAENASTAYEKYLALL